MPFCLGYNFRLILYPDILDGYNFSLILYPIFYALILQRTRVIQDDISGKVTFMLDGLLNPSLSLEFQLLFPQDIRPLAFLY